MGHALLGGGGESRERGEKGESNGESEIFCTLDCVGTCGRANTKTKDRFETRRVRDRDHLRGRGKIGMAGVVGRLLGWGG